MTVEERGSRLRLFVAVPVPAQVRAAVAEAATALRSLGSHDSHGSSMRWTDPASWHVTVAFLGSTDADLVVPLTIALCEVASGCAPFSVRLRPMAGRSARQGVLWVELEPSEPLEALAAAVRSALQTLGIKGEDRAFRPHLTLARSRGRAPIPRSLVDAYHGPPAGWTVGGLELMRSHLGRTTHYESVSAIPFGSRSTRA